MWVHMTKGRVILYFVLLVFLLACAPPEEGGKAVCAQLIAKQDLTEFKQRRENLPSVQQADVDAKEGLTLKIQPRADQEFGHRLIMLEGDRVITAIDTDGWFSGYSLHRVGRAFFWLVEDYSGGAHCCTSIHVLYKPDGGGPIRYLKHIYLGHQDEVYNKPLICRNGKNYLRFYDNRFAYFHSSFAESGMMFFPTHYLISADRIEVDNIPFKQAYLDQIAEINKQLQEQLTKRVEKPETWLERDNGWGGFSDEAGILLAARTIYSMCAREDRPGWEALATELPQYYRTSDGMTEMQKEIMATMSSSPY